MSYFRLVPSNPFALLIAVASGASRRAASRSMSYSSQRTPINLLIIAIVPRAFSDPRMVLFHFSSSRTTPGSKAACMNAPMLSMYLLTIPGSTLMSRPLASFPYRLLAACKRNVPSPKKFSFKSFGNTSNGSSLNPETKADVIRVCGTKYSVSIYLPVFPSALGM